MEKFPDRIFVFVPVAETPPFVSGWIPPVSVIDQPIWEPYMIDNSYYHLSTEERIQRAILIRENKLLAAAAAAAPSIIVEK